MMAARLSIQRADEAHPASSFLQFGSAFRPPRSRPALLPNARRSTSRCDRRFDVCEARYSSASPLGLLPAPCCIANFSARDREQMAMPVRSRTAPDGGEDARGLVRIVPVRPLAPPASRRFRRAGGSGRRCGCLRAAVQASRSSARTRSRMPVRPRPNTGPSESRCRHRKSRRSTGRPGSARRHWSRAPWRGEARWSSPPGSRDRRSAPAGRRPRSAARSMREVSLMPGACARAFCSRVWMLFSRPSSSM